MKKIVIIGGVAGGASAATRLRRLDEKAKIIMFERGPHVSFSSCGLPYRLGNVIKETESLFVTTPKQFYNNFNIDARINEEVIEIDRKNNKVKVKKIETEEIYEETYDKLILSPGANPIVPKFPGIEKVQVFTVKTVVDVMNIIKFLNDKEVKEITIIGGGFIGVETAENLREIGYNITLIEAMPQILKPFDYDMVQIFHKELMDKGVNLILNKKVEGFEENKVLLSSGEKVKTDLVLMAIGVSPETTLAKNANLDIGKMGGIRTNQNYMTNDSDIYAIGDAIEVYSPLFHDYFKLALAGPAQKQGRAVADHINDLPVDNRGFIGTSIIKVFDYNGASTGMTEGFIKAMNLNVNYDTVALVAHDSVSIMPNSNPMYFKLVYEIPTGKILGAQAIGKGDVARRIDVIATSIKYNGTIYDLKDLELCYAPPFGTAKDVVNYAGYIASNLMNDTYKHCSFAKVRELVENGEYIIDARPPEIFEKVHIKGAINIPICEIRKRIDEIPKDRTVYIHCKTGLTSYNGALILQSLGIKDVVSVDCGFSLLSYYEYFNDKTQSREPIVTKYMF